MSSGRKSGIALALGVATGSLTWAMLTALGLFTLLTTYASAITIIKIFGGIYLQWLAYKAFRSAASVQDREARSWMAKTDRLSAMHCAGTSFR